MIYLESLDQAKRYLGLTWPNGDPQDQELLAHIDIAEAAIADYLKVPTTPEKFAGNLVVRGATLRQLADLWRFRGDDAETLAAGNVSSDHRTPDGYLSPLVTSLLHRLRDPALA